MKLINKMYHNVGEKVFKITRDIIYFFKRKKLKNKNVTIITSDCLGGIIYHDLKLKFNSPTINLYIEPKYFVKFCRNLEHYLSLEFTENTSYSHVAGNLGDVIVHFLHYKTFDEAIETWNKRKKRIDMKNICFIMTCKDGCTEKDVIEFDRLPYKSKVCFTTKKMNKYSSTYYISGSENGNEIKFLGEKTNHFGSKYIDKFDIVSFINNCRS